MAVGRGSPGGRMFPDLFKLNGRVALVTGGSKGLGKSMARGFAEAGADVLISSRHEDELRQTAGELASGVTSRIEWAVTDMVNRGAVDALAELALQRFGRVDIPSKRRRIARHL